MEGAVRRRGTSACRRLYGTEPGRGTLFDRGGPVIPTSDGARREAAGFGGRLLLALLLTTPGLAASAQVPVPSHAGSLADPHILDEAGLAALFEAPACLDGYRPAQEGPLVRLDARPGDLRDTT